MRNTLYSWSAIVFMAVILVSCQKSGVREAPVYTIEQFMNTTAITGSSFSYDGRRILFTSDKSGIFNGYTMPVKGGPATQVTHSDSNSIFTVSFFPGDDRILFMSDREGNEIWHIYMRDSDGSVRDLTPFPGARSTFFGWSHDLSSFYFLCNRRDPRALDLYKMAIDDFTPELIFQNDNRYIVEAISADERYLALVKSITRKNSEMYLHDLRSGETRHLSPHKGDINYFPVTFSNDSRNLYYLTDEGSEFTYLKRFSLDSGEKQVVEKTNWDIMYAYFSYNEKYLVIGINNDARTQIKIYETATWSEVPLPKFPSGDITQVRISRDEKLMSFYVDGSRSPKNLYLYRFATGKYRKLTESLSPEIDEKDLVDAVVVRYRSFDGLEIPALLYKPHSVKPDRTAPGLIWVHGGPGGQSRVGYRALIQYLVNHGYVVLAVNNRGSSGYGKTFFQLDDRRHGEDDLEDCIEGKNYLVAKGLADPDRVGIIGGSYGGYMVLAALAFRPGEFAVGVDLFGISNWLRTLKNIPAWWEAYREALYQEMGNPETDEAYLREISPLFHADDIRRPLMVLQGTNDPRVLKSESDDIVAAVARNGVPHEYLLFEDEGHGFTKKANRIKGYRAILNFLDKHLKNSAGLQEPARRE